jgi:hypothetical protein
MGCTNEVTAWPRRQVARDRCLQVDTRFHNARLAKNLEQINVGSRSCASSIEYAISAAQRRIRAMHCAGPATRLWTPCPRR